MTSMSDAVNLAPPGSKEECRIRDVTMQELIQTHLDDGWRMNGGVSAVYSPTTTTGVKLFQSMVRTIEIKRWTR